MLLPPVVAEAAVRMLSPRGSMLRPAQVRAAEYFEPKEIERGARFARPQSLLLLGREGVQLGVLALLVASGRRTKPRRPTAKRRHVVEGALAGVKLLGVVSAASLPVTVASRRRAMAVGLVTQRWSSWIKDLAMSTAIAEALAAGAGAAAVGLTRRFPRHWWLPAAAGSVAAGAAFGAAVPVLLAPLFNDFEPLPEGQTRSDVLELAQASSVEVGEVYRVDASRRTTGVNAYVTGLGPTKRVVLYDTLLARYGRREVRIVVAHELSHVRHRDVIRAVAFSAIVALPAGWAVQNLSWVLSPHRGTSEALPAMGLASVLVSAPVSLVAGRLSRAIERRADAESLELSDDPESFIGFHRAIALQNVTDVNPPRWVRLLLASHPPTLERIGTAVTFRDRRPNGRPASPA